MPAAAAAAPPSWGHATVREQACSAPFTPQGGRQGAQEWRGGGGEGTLPEGHLVRRPTATRRTANTDEQAPRSASSPRTPGGAAQAAQAAADRQPQWPRGGAEDRTRNEHRCTDQPGRGSGAHSATSARPSRHRPRSTAVFMVDCLGRWGGRVQEEVRDIGCAEARGAGLCGTAPCALCLPRGGARRRS